ncbi:hypothetical protein, partial [Bradyrhizobium hipponense]|uniref:hypothetical protein n=1 Tax=Bradyrhizobium hipponense TaxID=2605638 RepID=UPI001AEDD0D4
PGPITTGANYCAKQVTPSPRNYACLWLWIPDLRALEARLSGTTSARDLARSNNISNALAKFHRVV